MRVVFDTNVNIAAFVSDGVCARLVRRARKREFELFLCHIVIGVESTWKMQNPVTQKF